MVTTVCRALLVFVLIVALWPGAVRAGQQEPFDPELFLQLERSLLVASARHDTMMLETLVAPRFVLRANPDVDRANWLRSVMTGCWSEQADIERFDARRVGDAVSTSFVMTMYRDPQSCREAVMKSLVTSVWVFEEGHWQLAVRQAIPPGTVAAAWMRQQFSKESERPIHLDSKAELSFVATAGNASTQTIGTGGELNYRANGWATAVKSSFVSTRTTKGNTESLGVDLREAHSRPSRIEMYAHVAFLRDQFAGINQRYAVDAGLGYPVVRRRQQSFKFDFGFGYTREVRYAGLSPAFPTFVASSVYTWSISPTSSLSNEARVTSNLRQTGDWRLANSVSVTIGLNRMLALKLSDKLNFLNRPVQGFVRADTVVSAALVLQFAR